MKEKKNTKRWKEVKEPNISKGIYKSDYKIKVRRIHINEDFDKNHVIRS